MGFYNGHIFGCHPGKEIVNHCRTNTFTLQRAGYSSTIQPDNIIFQCAVTNSTNHPSVFVGYHKIFIHL